MTVKSTVEHPINYLETLSIISKEVAEIFPEVEAIIHWGGSAKRQGFNGLGDVDILIVVPTNYDIKPENLALLKSKISEVDLDPYAVTEDNLSKDPIITVGQNGIYECHGMIHYQLKNESEVIYGDKSILNHIPPFSLEKALIDIVPYIKTTAIPRIEASLQNDDMKNFINNSASSLIVFARTIYSCKEHGVATKEESLIYLQQKYPEFTLLSEILLKRYRKEKFAVEGLSKETVAEFLNIAKKIFADYIKSDI